MKKLVFVLLLVLLSISVQANIFSDMFSFLFGSNEGIREAQQTGLNIIVDNPRWNVIKYTGIEAEKFNVTTELVGQNTKVCLYPKEPMRLNDPVVSSLRTFTRSNDVDIERTGDTEKESARGDLVKYCMDVTGQDYVKFGSNTIVVEYQNISLINYKSEWFDLNVTLFVDINNNWDNTVNDLFVYDGELKKFGANYTGTTNTSHFKYLIYSNALIWTKDIHNYYLTSNNEVHNIDLSDICDLRHNETDIEFDPSCTISPIQMDGNYYFEVDFYAPYNQTLGAVLVDPTISITNVSNVVTWNQNITKEPYPAVHSRTDPALLLYMPFDLDNRTYLYDYSDYSNDGQMYVDMNWTDSGCFIGGCIRANMTEFTRVDLGTPASLERQNNFTVMVWAYAVQDESMTFIDRGNTFSNADRNQEYWLRRFTTNDVVQFIVGDGTSAETATSANDVMPTNKWVHVAGRINGTHLQVFINGTPSGSSTAFTLTSGLATDFTYLGTAKTSGLVSYSLYGRMDEVMIWNKSLSNAEILAIYNNQSQIMLQDSLQTFPLQNITQDGTQNQVNLTTNTSQLSGYIETRLKQWDGVRYNDSIDGIVDNNIVGWWHFDNRSGYEDNSVIFDWSGNGINATYVNNAFHEPNQGKYGGSVALSGTNDRVTIGNVPGLNGSNNFTVSIWVQNREDHSVFSQFEVIEDIASDKIFRIYWDSDEKFKAETYLSGSYTLASGSTVITDQEWHHLLIRYNSTTFNLYLDGKLDGTNTGTGTLSFNASDVRVGGTGVEWNGHIDELMMWNRSLSNEEILKIYAIGQLELENTAWQNITNGVNQVTTFTIETDTEQFSPEFRYVGITHAPVLYDNLGLNIGATPTVDVTAPTISALTNLSTTNESSIISFSCEENCNYTIEWDDNSDFSSITGTIANNTFGTSHTPFLTSLLNLTTYYINLSVSDSSGNFAFNNTFSFITANNEALAAGTCDCPSSGDWVISDGSFCSLTTTCDMGTNIVKGDNGGLRIDGGTLITGGIAKSDSFKLAKSDTGKIEIG